MNIKDAEKEIQEALKNGLLIDKVPVEVVLAALKYYRDNYDYATGCTVNAEARVSILAAGLESIINSGCEGCQEARTMAKDALNLAFEK